MRKELALLGASALTLLSCSRSVDANGQPIEYPINRAPASIQFSSDILLEKYTKNILRVRDSSGISHYTTLNNPAVGKAFSFITERCELIATPSADPSHVYSDSWIFLVRDGCLPELTPKY